jgi:hypothetical protein
VSKRIHCAPNPPWLVANEFSSVLVELDDAGRSRRLRVTHKVSGREVFLDALQLEALVSLTPRDFWEMLDPSDLGEQHGAG